MIVGKIGKDTGAGDDQEQCRQRWADPARPPLSPDPRPAQPATSAVVAAPIVVIMLVVEGMQFTTLGISNSTLKHLLTVHLVSARPLMFVALF